MSIGALWFWLSGVLSRRCSPISRFSGRNSQDIAASRFATANDLTASLTAIISVTSTGLKAGVVSASLAASVSTVLTASGVAASLTACGLTARVMGCSGASVAAVL